MPQSVRSATEAPSFGTAGLSGFVRGVADDRPPLVLLHGLTFDHRMWAPAIDNLQIHDPGRRLLVLDLPGHGASPLTPSCDLADVAAAVASAVDHAGLDGPVMVGHSMSAIVASIYAATYPTRGVVNVDGALDTSFVRVLHANRAVLAGPGFAQMWSAILSSMHIDLLPQSARQLLNTEPPRQDVVLSYWRQPLDLPPADIEAMSDATLEALKRQGLPYMVVAGHEYDDAYTAQLREALPQATVTVIPNSGHFPHLADPARFAKLLAGTGQWRNRALRNEPLE